MMHRKDYLDDLAKAKLAKSAYELGLEVGEQGHLDTVGWVGAELRHLLQQAEELQVVDIVRRRYEFGRENHLLDTIHSLDCTNWGNSYPQSAPLNLTVSLSGYYDTTGTYSFYH